MLRFLPDNALAQSTKHTPPCPMAEEPMRIQKYLAQAGACSRREAERLVAEGKVSVNGRQAEIGQPVTPGKDVVKVGRKVIGGLVRTTVLMMNKPRGYLCTNLDEFGGQTVFELVPPPFDKQRMFCVGRLDKDSEGLLLITNDGALAIGEWAEAGTVVFLFSVAQWLETRTMDRAREAIRAESGIETELSTSGGTSDGRFIAQVCPQVIELGPTNATIHKIDECVPVADIEPLKNIYRRVLEKLAA